MTEKLLILSTSARVLAESAAKAGFQIYVIDQFADRETHFVSESCVRVSGSATGFDKTALRLAFKNSQSEHGNMPVLPGSGFEHCPFYLQRLAGPAELLGNSVQCIQTVKYPAKLAGLLRKLSIPHPLVISGRCLPRTGTWLVKRTAAEGGAHVRFWRAGKYVRTGEYLQQFKTGQLLSAMFLSNGQQVSLVGCHEQWLSAASRNDSVAFNYCGAVSEPGVSPLSSLFLEYAERLVEATGLRGLFGLDGIVDERKQLWLIEVNPRPPVTLELHESGDQSLVAAHINSLRGEAVDWIPESQLSTGQVVVYGDTPTTIAAEFEWPNWCLDIHRGCENFGYGQPICTISACADDKMDTIELLEQRYRHLKKTLRQANQ